MNRLRSFRLTCLSVVIVLLAGILAYRQTRPPSPPPAWMTLLDRAENFELLSLKPDLDSGDFHGHEVYGRTSVTDPATRKKLIQSLEDSAALSNRNGVALCFDPRHGIRVTHAGVTTDFLICFECRQVEVWQNDKRIAYFIITDSPHSLFDNTLTSAGITLAPKDWK